MVPAWVSHADQIHALVNVITLPRLLQDTKTLALRVMQLTPRLLRARRGLECVSELQVGAPWTGLHGVARVARVSILVL